MKRTDTYVQFGSWKASAVCGLLSCRAGLCSALQLQVCRFEFPNHPEIEMSQMVVNIHLDERVWQSVVHDTAWRWFNLSRHFTIDVDSVSEGAASFWFPIDCQDRLSFSPHRTHSSSCALRGEFCRSLRLPNRLPRCSWTSS